MALHTTQLKNCYRYNIKPTKSQISPISIVNEPNIVTDNEFNFSCFFVMLLGRRSKNQLVTHRGDKQKKTTI